MSNNLPVSLLGCPEGMFVGCNIFWPCLFWSWAFPNFDSSYLMASGAGCLAFSDSLMYVTTFQEKLFQTKSCSIYLAAFYWFAGWGAGHPYLWCGFLFLSGVELGREQEARLMWSWIKRQDLTAVLRGLWNCLGSFWQLQIRGMECSCPICNLGYVTEGIWVRSGTESYLSLGTPINCHKFSSLFTLRSIWHRKVAESSLTKNTFPLLSIVPRVLTFVTSCRFNAWVFFSFLKQRFGRNFNIKTEDSELCTMVTEDPFPTSEMWRSTPGPPKKTIFAQTNTSALCFLLKMHNFWEKGKKTTGEKRTHSKLYQQLCSLLMENFKWKNFVILAGRTGLESKVVLLSQKRTVKWSWCCQYPPGKTIRQN